MGKRLLGNISRLLKEAKGISEKFKEEAGLDNVPFREENLGALERGDLFKSLHAWAENNTRSLRADIGIIQRTNWAIYEKKRLNELIASLTREVDKLVILFPATKARQDAMCRASFQDH